LLNILGNIARFSVSHDCRPHRYASHTVRPSAPLTSAAVLFKFTPGVTAAHREAFVRELKKLKALPCVLGNKLIVGGPSITDPAERSKGFQHALLSFHRDRAALEEYQASREHHE
jgi:hypothetical protein